ncbi:hypothetical protein VFPPC_14452 [Pochonia chlamydosporia 170]|uniref:Uncharacterized protein n=1 Tax=Pochonia chlamydosporia 170 TaxID=1380566 RepID=A0A179FPB3_METCM|nr:hypothetical protein VFPPC_14452 [Pochonia chlamydosporia 170]OAQ67207.1 hypothetical protein VFPPC_14452 [Pochonia chlamydosporia 170]
MEPPPSYSESQVNYVTLTNTNPRELDYEGCTHRHELLITIQDTPNQLRPVALHYWNITETGVLSEQHLLVPGNLSLPSLQLVKDFQDLGTISLPTDAVAHSTTIHHYITSRISELKEQLIPSTSHQDLIPTLLAHLRQKPVSQPSDIVQVASVPVYSNSPDNLLDGGPAIVWKWVKPSSASLVGSGFWEPELDQCLYAGEWSAGNKLSILMKGVSDERKDELRRKRVLTGA